MLNPFKKPEPVRVEVDGTPLLIRVLSAGEYYGIVCREQSAPASERWRFVFEMISACVLDTQGQRLFPTGQAAEDMDRDTHDKLRDLCFLHNGMSGNDAKKND